MSLITSFELLALYNQAMNNNVYQAASKLGASDLTKNQGAFFGSIINTLNHLLVADTIWLQRFARHDMAFAALDYVRGLTPPAALNSILYADFNALKTARETMDTVIKAFVAELTDAAIAAPLSYTNTKGVAFTKNVGHLLLHFFNHQTHHRGQISTLLFQQGVDIGVTDLLVSIPDIA